MRLFYFVLLNLNNNRKNKEKLLHDINELKELHDFAEIIPISATKNDNVDLLINWGSLYGS